MKQLPKLIVLVGPTGSGKSDLAIRIAKKIGGEIVSADSRMIYRDMKIGTAVPTPIQRRSHTCARSWIIAGIPHWLIGFQSLDKMYTVAEYQHDALHAIRDILHRGKVPILVGGTGLYVRAITENLQFPAVAPQPALRKKLEKIPLKKLWQRLIKLDPACAQFVQKNNRRRVIRALEVCLTTGEKFSDLRQGGAPLFDCLVLGLKVDLKKLYPRLDNRVRQQIKNGLVAETRRLLRKYPQRPAPLRGFMYREVLDFIDNKYDRAEMIQRMQFANHAYARRQYTWFRKYSHVRWTTNKTTVAPLIKKFLK